MVEQRGERTYVDRVKSEYKLIVFQFLSSIDFHDPGETLAIVEFAVALTKTVVVPLPFFLAAVRDMGAKDSFFV